ncbi:hypothetical protein GCM10022224_080700 [Nonomuraea antimicrobica]|uniref:Nucleotidyl transferase AbiEii toxin, Type IV TA system n=2 Tax=Nonomuraea antimicrobica TaxID=561173 RepID=A0ABP7DCW0_9ACTN
MVAIRSPPPPSARPEVQPGCPFTKGLPITPYKAGRGPSGWPTDRRIVAARGPIATLSDLPADARHSGRPGINPDQDKKERYPDRPPDAGTRMIVTFIPMDHGARSLNLTDVTTALNITLDALEAAKTDTAYRVCGTSAALLQGVPIPAGDIDILLASREDVNTFAAALSSFRCLYAASWFPESSQYFTRFEVNGIEVELSTVERQVDSDGMECAGSGPWQHYVLITCGSHQVPVVRLELRLVTELLRDRPDRYDPLLDYLGTHGFDSDLLQRAMNAHQIPAHHRRLTQDRLAHSAFDTPPPA